MGENLRVTRDEAAIIIPVLERMSRTAGYPLSVDRLLHDWCAFVSQVERGYDGCIYEYENDLSSRDLLEEIAAAAPEGLRTRILAALESWDRRFDEATVLTSRPLPVRGKRHAPTWWRVRIPRRLSGQLREDLAAEEAATGDSCNEGTRVGLSDGELEWKHR